MAHSVSSKAPPHFVKNSPCFQQVSSVVCEGWVLKKRRKKMQGFARRYFVLYRTGLLQYSFGPDQPVRDRISLQHAAISTAPGRKDIHIDSNTATFHIKCLSIGDFNMWMAALRKFIASGNEAKQSFSSRRSIRQASMPKSECLVENMVPLIEQLEEAILLLLQEFPAKKTPNQSKKQEKDRHKDQSRDVLNIFRKYSLHQPGTDDTSPDLPPSAQQVLRLLEQLKTQNAILLKSLQTRVTAEIPSIYHSSLPPTTEEPICGEFGQPGPSQCPRRHSIATTISDSTHEWHDAADVMSDGPEEFVVESQSSPEQPELVSRQSSLEQLDRSGDETDLEEGQSALRDFSKYDAQTAIRRSQLPSRALGDEGSLLAMLKQNVGKDLSTITLPVTFNEPLTLLERLAEEVEYHNLLDEAVRAGNPVDRLSLVVAFAVSGYAHTRHRSGRKGFNPMLAETFEDTRMKFIAEKVRHHPVELAYHAEGDEWELSATSAGRTKFWGKSLEIVPQGNTRLRIGGDHFTWTRPSSFMRNLIVGTKYFEHCGEMIVENHTNHYRCVVEFKQNGYWGPSNVISGNIYSPTGDIVSRLEGKWDDQISQTFDSSHFRVLWRINPFPKETQDFYGFTAFGITLNEIIPNMVGKLPPTDSRYRPDVQALERGNVDAAEGAKNRMEEMQRERRKQRQDRKPRWFKQVGEEWVYTGGYWEARASGWKSESVQPLW